MSEEDISWSLRDLVDSSTPLSTTDTGNVDLGPIQRPQRGSNPTQGSSSSSFQSVATEPMQRQPMAIRSANRDPSHGLIAPQPIRPYHPASNLENFVHRHAGPQSVQVQRMAASPTTGLTAQTTFAELTTRPGVFASQPAHGTSLAPAVLGNNAQLANNAVAGPSNHNPINQDHITLFRQALDRMAANDWITTWTGNYEHEGPTAFNPTGEIDDTLTHDNFTPTTMAAFGNGVQRPANDFERRLAQKTSMSANYRGDPGNWRNYSHINLPDELNTSFWITHLPVDVTVAEVLQAIVNCGRVYSIHINRGDAKRLGHAACKLIWMDYEGQVNFYHNYAIHQSLVIRGRRAFICRNRNKVPESGLPRECTRCIVVTGPSHVVNMAFLTRYFNPRFKYQIDRIIPRLNLAQNTTTIEIRFGSYRAQAAMAVAILRRSFVFRRNNVQVRFARDPCDIAQLPQLQDPRQS